MAADPLRRAAAWLLPLLALLTACAPPTGINRVALLAPFEGRYREIGYNALYAARLAFADFADQSVELLPVDDGGTAQSAADRALALSSDPLITAVIALGYAATTAETQNRLNPKPMLIVGTWGVQPQHPNVYILANPLLDDMVTVSSRLPVTAVSRLETPLVGSDILALEQVRRLYPALEGVTIISSAALPDDDFNARYRQTGLFPPAPGLLATLTYDATALALTSIRDQTSVENADYLGLNGRFRFNQGYWSDAPIHRYTYDLACLAAEGGLCLVPAPF